MTVRNGHDRVVVEVGDRGPGIPEADRTRIFAPFYRGTRQAPGHGLGLAIGARLCAQASASLDVETRPDGGTIARIAWPVWQAGTAR